MKDLQRKHGAQLAIMAPSIVYTQQHWGLWHEERVEAVLTCKQPSLLEAAPSPAQLCPAHTHMDPVSILHHHPRTNMPHLFSYLSNKPKLTEVFTPSSMSAGLESGQICDIGCVSLPAHATMEVLKLKVYSQLALARDKLVILDALLGGLNELPTRSWSISLFKVSVRDGWEAPSLSRWEMIPAAK